MGISNVRGSIGRARRWIQQTPARRCLVASLSTSALGFTAVNEAIAWKLGIGAVPAAIVAVPPTLVLTSLVTALSFPIRAVGRFLLSRIDFKTLIKKAFSQRRREPVVQESSVPALEVQDDVPGLTHLHRLEVVRQVKGITRRKPKKETKRYEFEKKISSGGQGSIYKVNDGQHVRAMKVFDTRCGEGTEDEARFCREASLLEVNLASIRGTVNVYGSGIHRGEPIRIDDNSRIHEGQPFYLMEYVPGNNLLQVLRSRGPLDARRVVGYAKDLADTLREVHAAGVFHRDLKPANVAVNGDGRLKLLDFGIARNAETKNTITKPGFTVGTPGYMSPKQCETNDVYARSDVYSLGAVCFQLITGQLPIPFLEGEGAMAYMQRLPSVWEEQRRGRMPNIIYPEMQLGTQSSQGLQEFSNRMLHPDADARYQSMNQVLLALANLENTLEGGN